MSGASFTRKHVVKAALSAGAWVITSGRTFGALPSQLVDRDCLDTPPVEPDPSRSIHLIGDTHFGAISQRRAAVVLDDIRGDTFPRPVAHLQLGDVTDLGTSAQDRLALSWLNQLPSPWIAIAGNHDIWDNVRTKEAFASTYRNPSPDFTVDLGFVELICLSYDRLMPGDNGTMWLSESQMRWLDATLAAGRKDCLVACHSCLYGTVGGDDATMYTSFQPGFFVRSGPTVRDKAVRAILARHPRVRAWICGHTHSPTTAPDLVKREGVGNHMIAVVNCSALHYTGRTAEPWDPLVSLYLTCYPEHWEIRFRDHVEKRWVSLPLQSQVWTMKLRKVNRC